MSALGGVGSAAAIGASTTRTESDDTGFGELSNSEFFEIIMTELGSQDPLEPNDTKALIEQISLIRGIESDEKVTESLETLADQSEFSSAAGLIGALISGISEDGRRVSDLVTSVTQTQNGPIMNLLDGSRVRIDNVDEILGGPLLDFDGQTDDDDDDADGEGDG